MQDIARFYDARVWNKADLNAQMAYILSRPAHHHAGLVTDSDGTVPPEDEEQALIWLYKSEERMCDFLWRTMSALAQRQIHKVLDLGCGEGGTALRLCELAPRLQITGVTISEMQAQAAKRNCPQGAFLVGDMLSDDLGGPFDAAYAIESTEYLGSPGLAALMSRLRTLLAPEGLVIIIAGSKTSARNQDGTLKLRPDDPVVWAFDEHYKTRLASSDDYLRLAHTFGFRNCADIDLGLATLPYWEARRDHQALRNSEDGAIEALIAQVLSDGRGEYHLWGWINRGVRDNVP